MENKDFTQKSEDASALPPKVTKETILLDADNTKTKVAQLLKIILYVLASSLLVAIGIYCFISPNNFTIGGVSGLVVLINHLSKSPEMPNGISESFLMLALNLPLIVLAIVFIRKRFAVISVANIGLQSFWLFIFEQFFPDLKVQFTGGEAEKIFAAIAAGLCVGAAIALAFKVGGSTGGMDIAAVLIQKKFNASSIAWTLFAMSVIVISLSLFVFYDPAKAPAYNLLPVMLSVFESYIESKTNETMMNGFQSAIEFRIITDKPEEMAQALMRELHHGVTSIPATGMYTKSTHSMLLCVVNRRQVVTLKRIMKSIDPDAFAVLANVSQVLGLGFYTEEL